MKTLSRRSVQVLDFLRDLYAQQDVDAFAAQVVQSLPQLIATDMTSFNEVDPGTGKSRTVVSPAGADRFPGSEEIFEHHVREHPYVVHVRRFEDGQAHRVSDFIGRADFRRLAIYNEYYRRIGTEHQVAVSLPWAGPWVRGIALSRETRDYSDRERGLLGALAPHMVQACRNAEILARGHRAADNGSPAAVTARRAPTARPRRPTWKWSCYRRPEVFISPRREPVAGLPPTSADRARPRLPPAQQAGRLGARAGLRARGPQSRAAAPAAARRPARRSPPRDPAGRRMRSAGADHQRTAPPGAAGRSRGSRPQPARGAGPRVGRGRQDQWRDRDHPRRATAHRCQAPRADLQEARGGDANGGGGLRAHLSAS